MNSLNYFKLTFKTSDHLMIPLPEAYGYTQAQEEDLGQNNPAQRAQFPLPLARRVYNAAEQVGVFHYQLIVATLLPLQAQQEDPLAHDFARLNHNPLPVQRALFPQQPNEADQEAHPAE